MAETIEADDESWSEVLVTLTISTITSITFLTIYEVARRNPSLIEVFDRRRITKPNRTPPPLLRNKFAIFEWLFLSNDPSYSEYCDLAFMRDVIREKRKQRHPGRRNWNGFWNGGGLGGRTGSGTGAGDGGEEDEDEEGGGRVSNHRDHPNTTTTTDNSQGIEVNLHNNSNQTSSIMAPSRYSNSTGTNTTTTTTNNKKIIIRQHLTPDVVEVNGWRLPKEVAEYALANDLTEEQLYDYEQRLIEQERLDEIEYQRRRHDMVIEWKSNRSSNTTTKDSGNEYQHNIRKKEFMGNINHQLDDATLEELETDVYLKLPPRKSRFWYFGFQHSWAYNNNNNTKNNLNKRPSSSSSTHSQRASRLGKPVAILRSVLSSRYNSFNNGFDINDEQDNVNVHINRHLRSVSVLRKRPLSASDSELLRCIGLDTFVMIRFLRFCFDVTFFPFLAACIVLMPTYANSNFRGETISEDGTVKTQTEGYFMITINRLEPSSNYLWVCWGFAFFYIVYILRRLWIEWETFLPLRFDFLANGDVENEKEMKSYKSRKIVAPQNDVQLHLEQYRNSCIVEFIPDSHRRDQELFQFFEAVFPGQVNRAEILLNATELTSLMKKRQKLIEQYERIHAKFSYENKRYWQMKQGTLGDDDSSCWKCLKCRGLPKKPEDPTMHLGKTKLFCCRGKVVKALPHILAEIKSLNRRVEIEYKKVTKDKTIVVDRAENNDLFHKTMGTAKTMFTGEGNELMCDTGFVEFKSLTAKQSALQCNITGTNGYMVLTSAPDPRDVIWDNATVEKQTIIVKTAQCTLILFTGTLFWFAVIGFVTSLSNLDQYKEILPSRFFPEEDTILYDIIQGYIPVILLELFMLVVPFTLRIIAKNFIRFKTHSEIDEFIYKWHFAYRVTNLISIIVRQQILKTLDLLLNNPRRTIDYLAGTIAQSSQFFLNNMLVSAGTETMFELSQLKSIFSHMIMNRFITLEATSNRDLERMREPISLEWGEAIPPYIFALLVASVYSTVVPIVLGACALYFYVAAKVYTHQALFIYAQPYEGGGKLMYLLNRTVFGIVYITIFFFSAILGLKNTVATAIGFFILMTIITYVVDRSIRTTFVNPSTTLALTNARIIDEETKAHKERQRLYQEFRNEKKRKKKEEAQMTQRFYNSQNNDLSYLPNNLLLSSVPEVEENGDESFGLSAGGMSSRKQQQKSQSNDDPNGSTNASSTNYNGDDFFLYRQPQLNRTLWETKPRISSW